MVTGCFMNKVEPICRGEQQAMPGRQVWGQMGKSTRDLDFASQENQHHHMITIQCRTAIDLCVMDVA